MRGETDAILLRITRHSDTTTILHLYTREYGRIAYSVHGLHGRRSKFPPALLEPLAVLHLHVNHQATKDLQQIEDLSRVHLFSGIYGDMQRQTIVLFLAEVLSSILRHPLPDPLLFDAIVEALACLDAMEHPANFHLAFLLELSRYLGFYPNLDGSGRYFHLVSAELTSVGAADGTTLDEPTTRHLCALSNLPLEQSAQLQLSRYERQHLLTALVDYYSVHVADFYTPKSIEVLNELFD